MNYISQYINPELLFVVFTCSIFLLFVVGGYVIMFLNVMKSDPREHEFRDKHGWDDTLVPFKYKDELNN